MIALMAVMGKQKLKVSHVKHFIPKNALHGVKLVKMKDMAATKVKNAHITIRLSVETLSDTDYALTLNALLVI